MALPPAARYFRREKPRFLWVSTPPTMLHLIRDSSFSSAPAGFIDDSELPVSEAFRSCCLSGSAKVAVSMLKSLSEPSTPLQNTILGRLCDHGLFGLALNVHRICRASGCRPDGYTFPPVLKASSALHDVRSGTRAHTSLLKTGFDKNTVVLTSLLYFYGRTGRVDKARVLLDSIPAPDPVSWNALISCYSSQPSLENMLDTFREMRFSGSNPTVGTLASLLPLSAHPTHPHLGRSLHGLALKSGLLSDVALTPALISMYSKAGFLSSSMGLFEASDRTDVPAWNAVISASVRNHDPGRAVLMFRQMLRADLRPNALTFVAAIPSGADASGEALHCCSVKLGFAGRASVAAALVSMYGKCGYIRSAAAVFRGMPERSILSWNSMGSAYARAGFWEAGLSLLREMQSSGLAPDAVSLLMVLPACAGSRGVLLGKSTHGFAVRHGLDSSPNLSNALLSFYSVKRDPDACFRIFYKTRNVVSWNTIISHLVEDGYFREAVSMFREMRGGGGVEADSVTLVAVLPACDGSDPPEDGVHGHALKAGYGSDIAFSNAMVTAYVASGNFVSAENLFLEMAERDSVSWNALLTGYRRHGMDSEAVVLFRRMSAGASHGLKPNYVTLLNVLPVCRTLSQGGSVHAYSVRTGAVAEAPLATALMAMYARFGRMGSCRILFAAGGGRSVSLWNAMMAALMRSGQAWKSAALFSEMRRSGAHRPDRATVIGLISACAEAAGGCVSSSVMGFVVKAGHGRDLDVCNSVMYMYARGGDVAAARAVFDGMPERDGVSWAVMMGGYGSEGDGAAAVELLSAMRRLGVERDSVAYLGALSACGHAGMVEESRRVFGWLLGDGIEPSAEHYACVVDLLGRSGRVEEAYRLARRLPGPRLMNSLLAACGAHGNAAGLGHTIGGFLLKHDTDNPAVYVTLYGIYVAAGRWSCAERVRERMDRKRLRKVPGFSLLST